MWSSRASKPTLDGTLPSGSFPGSFSRPSVSNLAYDSEAFSSFLPSSHEEHPASTVEDEEWEEDVDLFLPESPRPPSLLPEEPVFPRRGSPSPPAEMMLDEALGLLDSPLGEEFDLGMGSEPFSPFSEFDGFGVSDLENGFPSVSAVPNPSHDQQQAQPQQQQRQQEEVSMMLRTPPIPAVVAPPPPPRVTELPPLPLPPPAPTTTTTTAVRRQRRQEQQQQPQPQQFLFVPPRPPPAPPSPYPTSSHSIIKTAESYARSPKTVTLTAAGGESCPLILTEPEFGFARPVDDLPASWVRPLRARTKPWMRHAADTRYVQVVRIVFVPSSPSSPPQQLKHQMNERLVKEEVSERISLWGRVMSSGGDEEEEEEGEEEDQQQKNRRRSVMCRLPLEPGVLRRKVKVKGKVNDEEDQKMIPVPVVLEAEFPFVVPRKLSSHVNGGALMQILVHWDNRPIYATVGIRVVARTPGSRDKKSVPFALGMRPAMLLSTYHTRTDVPPNVNPYAPISWAAHTQILRSDQRLQELRFESLQRTQNKKSAPRWTWTHIFPGMFSLDPMTCRKNVGYFDVPFVFSREDTLHLGGESGGGGSSSRGGAHQQKRKFPVQIPYPVDYAMKQQFYVATRDAITVTACEYPYIMTSLNRLHVLFDDARSEVLLRWYTTNRNKTVKRIRALMRSEYSNRIEQEQFQFPRTMGSGMLRGPVDKDDRLIFHEMVRDLHPRQQDGGGGGGAGAGSDSAVLLGVRRWRMERVVRGKTSWTELGFQRYASTATLTKEGDRNDASTSGEPPRKRRKLR